MDFKYLKLSSEYDKDISYKRKRSYTGCGEKISHALIVLGAGHAQLKMMPSLVQKAVDLQLP